jgi:hypothetical protein
MDGKNVVTITAPYASGAGVLLFAAGDPDLIKTSPVVFNQITVYQTNIPPGKRQAIGVYSITGASQHQTIGLTFLVDVPGTSVINTDNTDGPWVPGDVAVLQHS